MEGLALSVGGAVASAAVRAPVGELSSSGLRYLKFPFNLEEKLKSLEEGTLPLISTLLDHAEMLHFRAPVPETWLRELRGVGYDIEDALAEFATKAKLDLAASFKIGKKIDEIEHRFARLGNQRRDLINWANLPPPQAQIQISERPATSSVPTERYVFGRSGDKEQLVHLLVAGHAADPFFSVVPVVGMGGIGKTTLAREVYNDPRVVERFHLRMWVCVSNDLDVKRITEEMVVGASGNQPSGYSNEASLNTLQTNLQSKLSKQRFLLVLDDVWTEDRQVWETLRAPFYSGEEGSMVVITTRSRNVAGIMGTADPLFLEPLAKSDFWDLFESCAFAKGNRSGEHRRLEEIGREIAGRLKGVPLAAKTIGGLLSSKLDEGEWTKILNSEIWKLPQKENDIMPVLRLSYQQMPAHLKRCFTFCSLFPKNCRFNKERLVLLWMAQGFVQPQQGRIEDVGGEYFDDLVCRSFFQKDGDDDNYLMHDLVLDLAQSIWRDECVYIDDKAQEIPAKVLHLSLHPFSSFKFKDLYKLKRLRTLIYGYNRVPKKLFERLKHLRVLDLRGSGIVELPDSIGLLKHLRFLDLSYNHIRSLPEAVSDLCSLETMQLEFCPDLAALPKSMNKLTSLRHFKGAAALLSRVAGIGNLKSLQELGKFEVYREEPSRCNIGELKELTDLRGLDISGLENVMSGEEAKEASLTNKQYLHKLKLEWGDGSSRNAGVDHKAVLECLKPHPNLKTLHIKCNDGTHFSSWLADRHLSRLQEVVLFYCRRWKVLPPLGQLSSLKRLEIGGISGVEKLDPKFWGDNVGFPSLEELKIYDMSNWEWDEDVGLNESELFPSLRELDILNCPKLRVLPTLPPTLETLRLSGVGLIALPIIWGCNEASSSSASTSTSALSSLTITDCLELTSLQKGLLQHHHLCALRELEIIRCVILMDFPTQGFRNLISLKSLKIINCPNLSLLESVSLPSSLETLKISYMDQSLPNQLRNLTSLSSLSIEHCEELSTLGIQALTSLKDLDVRNCPKLTNLTNDSEEGLQNLIRLRSITIRECASYDFPTSELRSLPSLTKMEIVGCLKIRSLPNLTALEELVITSCPKLTSSTNGSREGLQNLIHLRSITIIDCSRYDFLTTELRSLPSLKKLEIVGCPQIHSLPDLTALEELVIRSCDQLWRLGIQALTSLKYLDVKSCPRLRSLTNDSSEGLQNLIHLEAISIRDCSTFDSLPTELRCLSSLHTLYIHDCPRIHSLPDLPDSLRHLYINNCPELAKRFKRGTSGWQRIARKRRIFIK